MTGTSPSSWLDVVLVALNVAQTCFLAFIAARRRD